MADRRNGGGYHRIREDYEIRSKQEAKKIIKDKDHSKIESQHSSNLLYSDNSADEWTGLDLSDDITISPSRLVIILLMLLYTYIFHFNY
jgi:hypothetical protein